MPEPDKKELQAEKKKYQNRLAMIRFLEGFLVLNLFMLLPELPERNLSMAALVFYAFMYVAFFVVSEIMVRRFKDRIRSLTELLGEPPAR